MGETIKICSVLYTDFQLLFRIIELNSLSCLEVA